jgi:hypothetical protein
MTTKSTEDDRIHFLLNVEKVQTANDEEENDKRG